MRVMHSAEDVSPNKQTRSNLTTDTGCHVSDKESSAAAAMLKLSACTPNPSTQPYSVTSSNSNIMATSGQNINHYETLLKKMDYNPAANILSQPPTSTSPCALDDEFSVSLAQRGNRKQREFIPEAKKDQHYWAKRRKNNEAAKRSREKRRMNDVAMGQRILELSTENAGLKAELKSVKEKYGLPVDEVFPYSESDFEMYKQENNDLPGIGGEVPSGVKSKTTAPGTIPSSVAQQIQQQHHHLNVQQTGKPVLPYSQPLVGLQGMAPQLAVGGIPMLIPVTGMQQPFAAFVPALMPQGMPGSSNQPQPAHKSQEVKSNNRSTDDISNSSSDGYGISQRRDSLGEKYTSARSDSSSPRSLVICSPSLSDSCTNSDSCGDDYNTSGNPLNLCMKPQDECWRGASESSVPLKLRHKLLHEKPELIDMSAQPTPDIYRNSVDEPSAMVVGSTTGKMMDPKYFERRRRNNLAARKCRENRKQMSTKRLEKSETLENENVKLKEEVQSLSEEIYNLKDLIDKKKQASERGESFQVPDQYREKFPM